MPHSASNPYEIFPMLDCWKSGVNSIKNDESSDEIFVYGGQNTFLDITNDLDQCRIVRKVLYKFD